MCNFVAVVIAVALLVEQRFELLHAVFAGGIKAEQITHHRGLAFIDNQMLVILLIPENAAVAKHDTGFDCLLMPEFNTRGEFAKLVLRDRRHDRKSKFGILVKRVDVVVLEKYADAPTEQFSCILQGIQRVPGKPRNFLRNNQVKRALLCISDHFVEVLSFLCGDARKSFIYITGDIRPCAIPFYQILIIRNLVIQ